MRGVTTKGGYDKGGVTTKAFMVECKSYTHCRLQWLVSFLINIKTHILRKQSNEFSNSLCDYIMKILTLLLNKMEAERMKLIYMKYVLVVRKEKEEGAREAKSQCRRGQGETRQTNRVYWHER